MNDLLRTIRDRLVTLLASARYKARRSQVAESPLRAELFSADQMEEHGHTLATFHRVQPGRGRNRLLARLDENEAVLVSTCALLSSAIRENRRVTPASEWLLDNYYLIDEHLRTARLHFPKGYSFQLPRLANGMSAGLPRIYDIALSAISHGDGRFDQDSLHRFVAAYQHTGAAEPRRAMGDSDHAAPGPDREPAPRRHARDAGPAPSRSRRRLGREHGRDRRARPQEPDPRRRRHGPFGSAG